jgi:proline iminopeptidase
MSKIIIVLFLVLSTSVFGFGKKIECDRIIKSINKKLTTPTKEFVALTNWYIFYHVLKFKYPTEYKCFNRTSTHAKILKKLYPLALKNIATTDVELIQGGLDIIYFSEAKIKYDQKLTGELTFDYVFYRIKQYFDPSAKAPLDFEKLILKEKPEKIGYYLAHVILYDSIFFKKHLNIINYQKIIKQLRELIPKMIEQDQIDLASEILQTLAHLGHTHSKEYLELKKYIQEFKFDPNVYWDHTKIVFMLAKLELKYQEPKLGAITNKHGTIKHYSYGNLADKRLIIAINGGPGWSHEVILPTSLISRHVPILYYDQLSTGASTKTLATTKNYNLNIAVENLDKIIQSHPGKEITLLGHSWGSMVAYEYAKKFPKKIKSLILASPILKSSLWVDTSKKFINKLKIKGTIKTDFFKRKISKKDFEILENAYNLKYVMKNTKDFNYLMSADFNPDIYLRLWGPTEFDFTGELSSYKGFKGKKITIPTLLVSGEFDTANKESLLEYQKYFTNAKVHIIENEVHAFFLNKNGDFLNMLTKFMSIPTQ